MNTSERRGALIVAIVAVLATAVGIYVKSCDRPLTQQEIETLYKIRETTVTADTTAGDTSAARHGEKADKRGNKKDGKDSKKGGVKKGRKEGSNKRKGGSKKGRKGGKQPAGPAVDPFAPV